MGTVRSELFAHNIHQPCINSLSLLLSWLLAALRSLSMLQVMLEYTVALLPVMLALLILMLLMVIFMPLPLPLPFNMLPLLPGKSVWLTLLHKPWNPLNNTATPSVIKIKKTTRLRNFYTWRNCVKTYALNCQMEQTQLFSFL